MKCFNCGNIFDAEDVIYRRESYGEKVACCPICGASDMDETEPCRICFDEFESGDLRRGFCLECLWESITYERALAYMKDRDTLCDFILSDWLEGGKIDSVSDKLRQHCEEVFKRMEADDKLMSRDNFLIACRYFILPNYPDNFGLADEGGDYAEWLEEVLND